MQLPNGVYTWSLLASKYVQEAVRNVKDYFQRERSGHLWPKHAPTPFPREFKPELDVSELLSDDGRHSFRCRLEYFGGWSRLAISILSQKYRCLRHASQHLEDRRGQLDTVFHMFAYLEKKHNPDLSLTQHTHRSIWTNSRNAIGRSTMEK
jgi:hypothetical protein